MKSRRDWVEAESCKRVTRTVGCDAVRRREKEEENEEEEEKSQRSRRRRRRALPKPCRRGSCNKIYFGQEKEGVVMISYAREPTRELVQA